MVPALDEVSTEYGLLAEAVSYPDDFSSVTYRLRAEAQMARRQAGDAGGRDLLVRGVQEEQPAARAPITATSSRPRRPASARSPSRSTAPGNRELPQIVGQLNVLPKHWWEGTDKDGKKRDVGATTLEPPLGCGAYRIKEFVARPHHRLRARQGLLGQGPQRQRRPRQFRRAAVRIFPRRHRRARGLQGRRGRLAHREQRQELGDRLRFPGGEGQARRARGISDPQLGVMQAFAFNIRRDKFKDPRVRRAFNYAFDFEEMNKQIFFGQYKRIDSYFEGTELASTRPAGGPRTRNPGNRARQGAARGVHHALHQSGQRQSRGGARQSARGDAAAARGRLRGPRPEAGQRQDRRAVHASSS